MTVANMIKGAPQRETLPPFPPCRQSPTRRMGAALPALGVNKNSSSVRLKIGTFSRLGLPFCFFFFTQKTEAGSHTLFVWFFVVSFSTRAGKTPEEIRKTFNIRNDFTPEEEEEVRRENQWAFE